MAIDFNKPIRDIHTEHVVKVLFHDKDDVLFTYDEFSRKQLVNMLLFEMNFENIPEGEGLQ
jgi:hypothetical protein